jgi:hypothetical protein
MAITTKAVITEEIRTTMKSSNEAEIRFMEVLVNSPLPTRRQRIIKVSTINSCP